MGKSLSGKELGKGIRQRANGKYEARYSVGGKSYSIYSDNLRELKAKLEFESAKANSNLAVAYKNYTLNEWFEEWFETYKKKGLKISSVAPMRRKYTNSFGRIIGRKKIADITNMDIQRVVNQLSEEGKAKSTIRDCLGRTRECFESAKNNNIIAVNPCIEIILPRVAEKKEERRFLTTEEQKTFLSVAEEKWYKEMFYIMFLTGMRVGEVGGLMWEDVDFKKKEIHVKRSLMCQYEKGVKTLRLTEPKTLNAYRTIPFMGEAEEMFLSQKEKYDRLKLELGDRWRSEYDGLVFCTTLGSECTRHIVEKEIKKIVKEINERERIEALYEHRNPEIFEDLYPHAIRHTFCSRCYERGIDVKVTQKLMGHSSIGITLDYYTHLGGKQFNDAVEKFGNMNE